MIFKSKRKKDLEILFGKTTKFTKMNIIPIAILTFLFTSLLFFFFNSSLNLFTIGDEKYYELKEKNALVISKIEILKNRFAKSINKFKNITEQDNYLRLAANLSPQTKKETAVGHGGGNFNEVFLTRSKDVNELVEEVDIITGNLNDLMISKLFSYNEISKKAKENIKLYSCIPAIKPAMGSISGRQFGVYRHPILKTMRMHEGIDIGGNHGDPIYASGDGVIADVGWHGGYGLCIDIDHGFGYKSRYAHLSKSYVTAGQKVTRGQLIAGMGSTGLSTSNHLHYEVHYQGIKRDPMLYFFDGIKLSDIKVNDTTDVN
ncbi:MAG: M23 family metallopeptidase [Ignavibacteriales bacterium]|nr:M23 family metallopeptidase [Ignavibacteriales bacterium]